MNAPRFFQEDEIVQDEEYEKFAAEYRMANPNDTEDQIKFWWDKRKVSPPRTGSLEIHYPDPDPRNDLATPC